MIQLLALAHLLLAPQPLYFENGKWYDGKNFVSGSFYSANGFLTHKKPSGTVETIDLKGNYVVPPLADAHCHHFDGEFMANRMIPMYLTDGIFYAQSMGNWIAGRDQIKSMVNKPDSVDVSFANALLTSTLGHPFAVYEPLANPTTKHLTYKETLDRIKNSRKGLGGAYFFVDDLKMLDEIWPKYLASKPDLVKIVLLDSAHYEQKRKAAVPGDNGLPAEVVPAIVKKAHAVGLRVYAHIETAYDFHVCVAAGVDGMAHMPGYDLGPNDPAPYLLDEKDVKAFARRHGVVQPTVSLAPHYSDNKPELLAKTQTLQKRNLAMLKRFGITIAIGSDSFGTDSWPEAEYLRALGVYTDPELLHIWVETTPETIFPARKIGRLAEGYEASFLTVKEDPRTDIRRLKDIVERVKNGEIMKLGVP